MRKHNENWITDRCFELSDALRQPTFIIDQAGNIADANGYAMAIFKQHGGQKEMLTIFPLFKDNTVCDLLERFWQTDRNCLTIKDCHIQKSIFDLVLLKVGEESNKIIVFMLKERELLLAESLKAKYDYLLVESGFEHNFKKIVGRSEQFRSLLKMVMQVADTKSSVIISGEIGTGKELLARTIHNLSSRRTRPLIKLNCAAIPSTAYEAELFGYEKNAFQGAFERKLGKFELADQSTLLLEEIGELPLAVQPKLLNVIENQRLVRLGSTTTSDVNIRFVATTSQNIKALVEAQKFRSDLYYALNVFPLESTPLRERVEDIPLLVDHFTKKYAEKLGKKIRRVSKKALKQLQLYNFPGNIRELENLVERAVILTEGGTLNLTAVLPDFKITTDVNGTLKTFLSFEEMQRQHIINALEKARWRVSGKFSAAELLEMNSKTLVSKMRKLNIRREDFVDK